MWDLFKTNLAFNLKVEKYIGPNFIQEIKMLSLPEEEVILKINNFLS